MKIFLVKLFLVICFNSVAQTSDSIFIKRLSDEIMVNSKAYANLRILCKDIGPRLSNSVNAGKAVHATAKMLREAGADTVYFQACQVPNWKRGVKETGIIKIGKSETYNLRLCALGNSPGTGKQGVSGEIIEVTSVDEIEKLGKAGVAGKIVFINMPMDPRILRTFSAYGAAGAGRRNGPAVSTKYGAAAVMVRSLASNIDEFPHTGATRYNDSFPKIPSVAISTKDAEWLSGKLKKYNATPHANKKAVITAHIKTYCEILPDVTSYNVIGEMRGSVFPEQIITVGGHLDSWDLGEGAQDDGAGCVQSIEILRAFKALGVKPKRTIRAVMFMDEENGGTGADKYLELAKQNKEKHVFALESDAGGYTPRGFNLDMDESRRAKILSWRNLFLPYGVYQLAPGGSGADIAGLKEIGTALAGFYPDSQRYFDIHHAATDVFEIVNKRELDLGAVNMAALIWLVSEYGL